MSLGDVFAGRRVLVTGHTGFKGSWLSLWLTELGAEVSGFALDPVGPLFGESAISGRLVRDFRGNVRDPTLVEAAVAASRPELVMHLAAQPLVRASYLDPVGTFATNVLGTAQLLDAVRRSDAACPVLVVTSDKVYKDAGRAGGNVEGDPLGGHDPYSASKAAAELVAAAWSSSFAQLIATARAGNVLGGGDQAADRLVPDVVRALSAGRPLVVRNAGAVRPWQHVLDALHGYLLVSAGLLGADAVSFARPWNFGPLAPSLTVAGVVELAIAAWGNGSWVAEPDADAPREEPSLLVDPTHAVRELGWAPHFDVATAVRRTIEWHRLVADGLPPDQACLRDIAAWHAGYDGHAGRAGNASAT
jgi:CDP-glucose 4,6-dehydratase